MHPPWSPWFARVRGGASWRRGLRAQSSRRVQELGRQDRWSRVPCRPFLLRALAWPYASGSASRGAETPRRRLPSRSQGRARSHQASVEQPADCRRTLGRSGVNATDAVFAASVRRTVVLAPRPARPAEQSSHRTAARLFGEVLDLPGRSQRRHSPRPWPTRPSRGRGALGAKGSPTLQVRLTVPRTTGRTTPASRRRGLRCCGLSVLLLVAASHRRERRMCRVASARLRGWRPPRPRRAARSGSRSAECGRPSRRCCPCRLDRSAWAAPCPRNRARPIRRCAAPTARGLPRCACVREASGADRIGSSKGIVARRARHHPSAPARTRSGTAWPDLSPHVAEAAIPSRRV